jgi:AraC family L-rhamnose operon transcriptional activator RhaR
VLGGKWWRNYLHVHSFVEVCHVSKGSGTFWINGKKHKVSAGDTFIAKPGQPHEIVSARRDPLDIYFWAHTVEPLDGAAASANSSTEATISALLALLPNASTPLVKIKSIDPVLRLMSHEMSARQPGYVHMINMLFGKLVVDTARAASPGAVPSEAAGVRSRSASESLVQTAMQYLLDNLGHRFEVRDVAAQVNLSERQLSRIFHKATGESILAYLTRLRIERAMHLLLNSDLPIKQVAAAVGHPDTHYFTTLFGRHTGTTPAAFRRSGGTEFLKPAKPKSPARAPGAPPA